MRGRRQPKRLHAQRTRLQTHMPYVVLLVHKFRNVHITGMVRETSGSVKLSDSDRQMDRIRLQDAADIAGGFAADEVEVRVEQRHQFAVCRVWVERGEAAVFDEGGADVTDASTNQRTAFNAGKS